MGAFLTPLRDECVDDTANDGRGIWRILEPFSFQSDVLGKTITVEKDFLTDYASVPRWPLIYWMFGDSSHRSAVIHDWLYHHHEICDEQTANKILLEAMEISGIPWWRRKGIYYGVMIGGSSSWKEDGLSNGHTIIDGKIV